jgi:hypothetical protein
MASSLAHQLRAINLAIGRPDVGRQRGRPSLLLDRYLAADLDVTDLLGEAEAGTILSTIGSDHWRFSVLQGTCRIACLFYVCILGLLHLISFHGVCVCGFISVH